MPDFGSWSDERINGRYLIAHFVGGMFTGWLVLGLMLYSNFSGLFTLLARSDMFFVAIVMLGTAFALTFGIAAVATSLCWGSAARTRAVSRSGGWLPPAAAQARKPRRP